jgi:hypothetical protein
MSPAQKARLQMRRRVLVQALQAWQQRLLHWFLSSE